MNTCDRVVLVTGASSGIGKATALRAAYDGAHLVLVARGVPSLRKAAAECTTAGAQSMLVIPTDVGDDAAVEACVARVLEEHGRIDAVISNAGVVAYGRTEEVPPEVFDGVLRTNLIGSVNLARHVVPVLRRQQAGSLLLVGSVIGHIGVPSMSPYVLSKWGVRVLARQLRLENRDLPDVHIVYVAPGGVDTPIYQQAANVHGYEGRPPPPVSSPERAARQILRRLDRDHAHPQLSLANDAIRFGFVALPRVYDLIVGPLFRVGAVDLERPIAPTAGNVTSSQEDRNALHGDQGSAVLGIGRNVLTRLRSLAPTGGSEPGR